MGAQIVQFDASIAPRFWEADAAGIGLPHALADQLVERIGDDFLVATQPLLGGLGGSELLLVGGLNDAATDLVAVLIDAETDGPQGEGEGLAACVVPTTLPAGI